MMFSKISSHVWSIAGRAASKSGFLQRPRLAFSTRPSYSYSTALRTTASPSSSHNESSNHQRETSSNSPFSYFFLTGLGLASLTAHSVFADDTAAAQPTTPPSSSSSSSSSPSQTPPAESTDSASPSASPSAPKKEKRKFKYVIVGAGTAAYHALYSIRTLDPEAEVLVVGEEQHPPYERPPLTTEMWSCPDPEVARRLRFVNWDGEEISLFVSVPEDFEKPVTFLQGRQAIGLHPAQHILVLDDYEIVVYEKLLLATGAEPKLLERIDDAVLDRVSTYRDIEDFQRLDALTRDLQQPLQLAVVGGSFLGTELVASLQRRPLVELTQVVSRKGPLGNVLPEYLAEELRRRFEAKGIRVITDERVTALTSNVETESDGASGDADPAAASKIRLQLNSTSHVDADHVVLAIGAEPRSDLAVEGKLEVTPDHGFIMVNAELQASLSDIYAAGDVASYFDQNVARRRVFDHFDHAASSGQLAGLNMTGKKYVYRHEPFWWVTLPDGLTLHGVGNTDSSLETVSVWRKDGEGAAEAAQKYERGIVYYVERVSETRKRIVGVLLWNLPERVESARKVLSSSSSQIISLENCIQKIPVYTPEEMKSTLSAKENQ